MIFDTMYENGVQSAFWCALPYTPQAGNEKGTGFLPFTGVRRN